MDCPAPSLQSNSPAGGGGLFRCLAGVERDGCANNGRACTERRGRYLGLRRALVAWPGTFTWYGGGRELGGREGHPQIQSIPRPGKLLHAPALALPCAALCPELLGAAHRGRDRARPLAGGSYGDQPQVARLDGRAPLGSGGGGDAIRTVERYRERTHSRLAEAGGPTGILQRNKAAAAP